MELVGIIAAIVTGIIGSIGVIAGIFRQRRKAGEKSHSTEARERGVAVGRDVNAPIVTGDQLTTGDPVVQAPSARIENINIHQGVDDAMRRKIDAIAEGTEEMLKRSSPRGSGDSEDAGSANADSNTSVSANVTEELFAEALSLQQQHNEIDAIDCLFEAYHRDLDPQAKIKIHVMVAAGFSRLSRQKEAEGHYLQALSIAEKATDRRGVAAALGGLGGVYTDLGDLGTAEEVLNRAIEVYREINYRLGEAIQLGSLGLVYRQRGDFARAERFHKDSLDIYEEIGEALGKATQLGNLGLVYFMRGELDQAAEFHSRALVIDRELGNRLAEGHDLGNLGILHASRGELAKAEEYFESALAIQREIGDRTGEANQLGNLANVYLDRRENEKGEEHLERSLAIHRQIGNRIGQANQLSNLANVYAVRGEFERALAHQTSALRLFEEIGATPQADKVRRLIQMLGGDTESSEPDAPEPPK